MEEKYNRRKIILSMNILHAIKQMEDKGWLSSFPDDHIIKMMLSGKDISHLISKEYVSQIYQNCDVSFTMLMNYNSLFNCMLKYYPEEGAEKFVVSQLSGLENGNIYNNKKFYQALSELLLFRQFCMYGSPQVEYEPQIGGNSGKKNPEYRIFNHFPEEGGDYIFDVEVKTIGGELGENIDSKSPVAIPLKTIDIKKKNELEQECNANGFQLELPDVIHIKDFINSAADKFVDIDENNHFNILCLNWTFRQMPSKSYLEPAQILTNNQNGLWVCKDIGMKFGIDPQAYEKISAIYIFNMPYEGVIFCDSRWSSIDNSLLIFNDNLSNDKKVFLRKMFGNPATSLRDMAFLTNCMEEPYGEILISGLCDAADLLKKIAYK